MRTTDDTTVAIENAAAHRAETGERLQTAQRECDEAQRARDALGYETAGVAAKVRLVILQAEAALEDASTRLAECERVHAVARGMWEALMRRAYADRHRARLQAALSAAEALAAGLAADRADRAAVAQALGLADAGPHPHADAARLVAALQSYRRVLDPPPPAPPAPPRPGTVRVRVVRPFWDHDAVYGIRQEIGAIYDMSAHLVREATAAGLVEAVEA